MFHYLFTNDLRISNLEKALTDAGRCFRDDCVPSAAEDKNANNNMNTLGFYFNLTRESNCASECAGGNVRKAVLNFIKKFQFPNPRTSESFENCVDDGIQLAPMRVILQTLYMMKMMYPDEAFLTKREIADYIFFNEHVAKNPTPDLPALVRDIVAGREESMNADIPTDSVLEGRECYWKQCRRQVREMVKILCWSGCVAENRDGTVEIRHDHLTRDNKADLFEIITYSGFWEPDMAGNRGALKKSYQQYMDLDTAEVMAPVRYHTGLVSAFPRNRILFGAPGTGKSHMLNHDLGVLLEDGGEYERVTFHPDYSYAGFVGTYKPVPVEDGISYEFVPGPFTRLYVKALRNSRTGDSKPYVLLVEEINRANVAAVFGDIFQLLDRDAEEKSEYPVHASEDLKKYLSKPEVLGGIPDDYEEIRIPDNMFIWATMNSADQGVYPMDTAFKRRWDFTYLGIDHGADQIAGYHFKLENGKTVSWNQLRTAINKRLAALKINEDKLMGPFFLSKKVLDGGDDSFVRAFKNKVLMYLFEDAGKQRRPEIFRTSGNPDGDVLLYSGICDRFERDGIGIFCDEITEKAPYVVIDYEQQQQGTPFNGDEITEKAPYVVIDYEQQQQGTPFNGDEITEKAPYVVREPGEAGDV